MTRMLNTTRLVKLITMIAVAATTVMWNSLAFSQSEPPAEAPPATQPTSGPSLDELLGIKGDGGDKKAAEAAAKDHSEDLKRHLDEADALNAFASAIQQMSVSAELLDNKFDPGLGTQRVQEDIIAKLSQLIDSAKKNKSKSKSSSSSSQSQQQQQDPGKQQQKNQNDSNDSQRNRSSNNAERDPPALQEGDINKMIEEDRTEWGNLPKRVRDMLLQGRKDKFSALYQKMTQDYYKRLAEEGSP